MMQWQRFLMAVLVIQAVPALAVERPPDDKTAQDERKPEPAKDTPAKDAPSKDMPAKDAPGKDKAKPAETAPNPNRTGPIKEFPAGSPDAVLREAFRCALEIPDEATGFACYAALNVESNRDTDIAIGQLRNYQWRFFRQRASTYVVSTNPFTIDVTRRDPGRLEKDAKEVKLFVRSSARDNPAPVMLRRVGDKWMIYANSL